MGTFPINSGAAVERLEARRLLCGDVVDAAFAHPTGGEVAEVSASAEVRNDATAHVIAAYAQGRGIRGAEVVWGETTVINGALLGTWAIVSRKDGAIVAAGATLPLALAEDQPQHGGAGPFGAIASLEYPAIVQEKTYFNHLEVHTEPQGHSAPPGSVNPDRNRVPHFDYHFYAIPEAQVWTIPFKTPPLPPVPTERLPVGYTQAGFSQLQMGRHSGPAWQLTDPNPLSTILLAGYLPDASRMHFVEPMISREFLLRAEDFTLPVPMPQKFDFDALYPTRFEAVFHAGAHYFIFSDFIDTDPTTPVGSAGPVLAQPATRAAFASEPVTTAAQRSAVTILVDGEDDGADEVLL
jgi:hypothetical protein